MDTFFTLPWRHGPALALVALGVALTVHGLQGMPNPTRRHVDIVAWLRGFRRIITGLALLMVGIAWLRHLPWLLAIALGAGLQEIRESTSYLLTLDKAGRGRQSAVAVGSRRCEGAGD